MNTITYRKPKSWKEAEQPPKFPDQYNLTVKFNFWLTPGHADNPGQWFVGTSPRGLFITNDGGNTWEPVDRYLNFPLINEIIHDDGGTPIGPLLHSININPENPDEMILAMSSGGAFRTLDKGMTWVPFNKNVLADFLPDPYPETGHCVHNMQIHPKNPHLVYQQGHCGVYRIDLDKDDEWTRIGDNLPREIGDIGFPLILHPRDPKTLWVIPMDGTEIWPRTSVDGKPALFKSTDGGESWCRQDNGLPDTAWFTVLRQASTVDNEDRVGLYFGNRNGEVWASIDEGESWNCIATHLPDVYSLKYIKVD